MELHFQAAQHPDHFVLQHCCSKCTERKRTIHPSSSPRTAPSKAATTTQCPVLCCSQPEGSCHQLLHPKHICTANQGLVLADDSSYQNKYIKGKRAASTMQMWQCIASLFLWEQLMVTSVANTKLFRVWRHHALKQWYHYWVSSFPPSRSWLSLPRQEPSAMFNTWLMQAAGCGRNHLVQCWTDQTLKQRRKTRIQGQEELQLWKLLLPLKPPKCTSLISPSMRTTTGSSSNKAVAWLPNICNIFLIEKSININIGIYFYYVNTEKSKSLRAGIEMFYSSPPFSLSKL